jgi:hypothetical protein
LDEVQGGFALKMSNLISFKFDFCHEHFFLLEMDGEYAFIVQFQVSNSVGKLLRKWSVINKVQGWVIHN